MAQLIDVPHALRHLTLDEKIRLLAGKDTWSTHEIKRLNIPSITTSDGPHGVRGTAFFNGPKGCLLPCATAMGATFDTRLMHSAGEMLAAEAREKGCHVLLAPTVCLQRSPLLGRAFEAFGEDPVLSGLMAASYVRGVQRHGVGVAIKHFAAHDQSARAPEDDVVASRRTLREAHLLPFQLAVKHADPWAFMSAYQRINGVHASEDPWLLEDVLRRDWGWDGLVMSDWFGSYSTAEAVNAGLDLEMPGPTHWRGPLLGLAVAARKVKRSTIDERVRNLLHLVNKVHPSPARGGSAPHDGGSSTAGTTPSNPFAEEGDTPEKRRLCREIAQSAIVLLKNEKHMLPLDPLKKRTYGLMGPAIHHPAGSGGGSADLRPYYLSRPLEAICEVVGEENVKTAVGCRGHLFTPLLVDGITVPGSTESGYLLEWFDGNPEEDPDLTPLHTARSTQAQMYFADSVPRGVPPAYVLRVRTVLTAEKSATLELGLCVIGRGKLSVDGDELIDLWTQHPEKTLPTPMFDQSSMEVVAELDVEAGRRYAISILLKNEGAVPGVGALQAGGLRVGCYEKVDPARALREAIELARQVDVPIVVAGLNADYESEAVDRTTLALPPAVDELIAEVLQANPNTIVVTQAGSPIAMPWLDRASTLVHAWFGGQETGHAMADVLFGRSNPSGRLSVSFPKRLEDTPAFLTWGKTDRHMFYGEGVFLGYRYYEKLKNPPLFYFGYGLSYTTFEYAHLTVPESVRFDDPLDRASFEVTVDVSNTGGHDGWEIVQVYVADRQCSVLRPVKELKGFAKVWIERSTTATVRVALDKYALSFWSEEEDRWVAEKGVFEVIVARSADPDDEVLRQEFRLEEDFSWSGL